MSVVPKGFSGYPVCCLFSFFTAEFESLCVHSSVSMWHSMCCFAIPGVEVLIQRAKLD